MRAPSIQGEQARAHHDGEGHIGQAQERDDQPPVAVGQPARLVGEPHEDARAHRVPEGERKELEGVRAADPCQVQKVV